MTLIRIAYLSELPNPSDLFSKLKAEKSASKHSDVYLARDQVSKSKDITGSDQVNEQSASLRSEEELVVSPVHPPLDNITALVALCKAHQEMALSGQLINNVHIVEFKYGKIDMRLKPGTPKEFVKKLSHFIREQTGTNWVIGVSEEVGSPTIHQVSLDKASSEPIVKSILDSFPGARVQKITNS
jgi:hypothetical protein